jgi:TonB family protein
VTSADLALLPAARQIRIKAGGYDYRLAPDRLPAAMAALRECEKDLLATWGMDPAAIAVIATFPHRPGGLASMFNSDDYPGSAIRKEEQGTSAVRFWVGTDGQARDCQIVESSGSAALDAKTCEVIAKRGKFEPARTAAGTAVDCIAYMRIRWVLPRDPRILPPVSI